MAKLPFDKTSKRRYAQAEQDDIQRLARDDLASRNWPVRPVHENLRRFREGVDLQKTQMAEVMEVTSRSYYTYEEGKRPIPSTALVRLGIFLNADLNELLLGRTFDPPGEIVDRIIDDLFSVLQFLADEYEGMDTETARSVARTVLKLDTRGLSRLHPGMIRDAVRIVARYRFHSEDLPAPPDEEMYGHDHAAYSAALAEWNQAVKEDFPPAAG